MPVAPDRAGRDCLAQLLRFGSKFARVFWRAGAPLIWLIVFASGFRAALGLSIIPPYETYITYDVYITPAWSA